MAKSKLAGYVQARELEASDLVKHLRAGRAKTHGTPTHHGSMASVRTDSYKGHEIRIETTYKITVDGRPVSGHVDLTNSGQIHYHPLPNRSAASAVEMVRAVIDSFPDDFETRKTVKRARKGKASKKTATRRASTAHRKRGR